VDSTTVPPWSASSRSEALSGGRERLLQGVVQLVTADDRPAAARRLARALGCDDMLIFVIDEALGVPLPAPGFPQTLPNGRAWQAFLKECSPGSVRRSRQRFPHTVKDQDVTAITAADGAVLVFLGTPSPSSEVEVVVQLLPLVSAALRREQTARVAQTEAAIAEQAAHDSQALADMLDQTRQDLHEALVRADRALRMRSDFLSIASHELRTPLTSLRLQVNLLQRQILTLPDATPGANKLSSMVSSLDRNLQRLTVLAHDLLDVAQINSGRLAIRRAPMDLADLAHEVADRFEDEATRRGCRLIVDASVSVEGEWDHSRLDQVLTNLISNALAYGRGHPVVVQVAPDSSYARLQVKDQGPGIAPDDQERIFHRFERAGSKDDGSGLGLGLYITREIVQAHGGRITVDSAPGAGARFIVELPCNAWCRRESKSGAVPG
jgi:signal transduction histidine kinase